jgi:hypothetical protein
MIPIDRRIARLTIVSTALAAVGAAAGPGAQDELLPKAAKVQEKPHGLAPALEGQVEKWIFMGFSTAEAARSWVENMLNDQIEDVERSAGLSGPQRKRLALACQGEVKSFFDGVDAFMRRIGQFQVPWNNDDFHEVLRESQSLRRDFGTQFASGEKSLFQKLIPRVLSGDQLARYEKALLDRRVFRYRAAVGWVAVLLGANLGWSPEQRQRFEEVVLAETRPPRKFPDSQDLDLVLFQISRVPERKLKPIFDDLQWRLLVQALSEARKVGPFLIQGGYVLDAGLDATPGAGAAATATQQARPD